MHFLKLRCERAYYTGAIRTTLDLPHLARKLRCAQLTATCSDDVLHITCAGDQFTFAGWAADGLERTGWLQFQTDGDIGRLSRALASLGVRHRFEHSRPLDLDTDDVRCVTSYDHLWQSPRIGVHRAATASIATYEERL